MPLKSENFSEGIMIKERFTKIADMLCDNEGFLITSDVARQYITGFKSSAGHLLITKNQGILFIDSRYFEKASAVIKHLKVMLLKSLDEQIKEAAEGLGIEHLYVETSEISVLEYKCFSKMLSPITVSTDGKIDKALKEQRQIKDSGEIECIRAAQKITDRAFSHILDFIKVGKTEREIALELEMFMRKNGSEGVAFDTIAVSGKNSSLPHGVPTDKPIAEGDFITMDFGAKIGGYCADMTRTVAVGFVSEKQEEVYETVLEAQKKAFFLIKNGAECAAVDAAARNLIRDRGYGEYFGHALGHSLGLLVHESPACSSRSKATLKSGMFMTVEPGIYIPENFGVRIEDFCLVTDNGYENFTESEKELIIL